MNVLMVSHYILPHNGGIEIIIEKLSSALALQGHQVRIIGGLVDRPLHQLEARREIIGFKVWDPLKNFGVHYPLFPPFALSALHNGVRWADVVHVQGMLYPNSLAAIWMARTMRKPAILTEHAGFVPYTRRMLNAAQSLAVGSAGQLSLRLSDRIIVPDTIVKDILIRSLGVESRKIVQIPLGVDADFFRPLSDHEKQRTRMELGWDEKPKILFVGNFVARKRLPLLLAAASNSFDIILCGEGTPPSPLPSQAKVYPAMAHPELVRLYQSADLFVVPSSVETFAIVAFEAMACGLPVIMTDDLKHLTIAKSDLVSFVPPDASAMQAKILALIGDPDRLKRVAAASVEWVKQHFSWQSSVRQHVQLYQELCGTRSWRVA